ncbi:polyprenyl synthetase family protein [Nostoc sp. FACHB-87]|uniref:polyprenyl synthetase family protein n=1 Tax=Nostocaceae TaxID=1162 RepID=UPI001685F4DD|nr:MULTISPECIES: polyprenyl synthetase family protein [Nostocaceae]MBD2459255.1 polyprenyl synthetase family protein [Nostoc sp. FACHB-87]MBD2478461.1 polyprenyl synthetase family protein [Anabaena sp. FACHB-83]
MISKLAINLVEILAQIRQKIISLVEDEWQELGKVVDEILDDPLNPTAIIPIATGISIGAKIDDLIAVAASVTLISLSFRIVDDCIDMDAPDGLYQSLGVGRAINYAMALNAVATREFINFKLPSDNLEGLLRDYFYSFLQVCQGQDKDISQTINSLDEYREIVNLKTVKAYQFATAIASYLSACDADIIALCVQCGTHLGWMTQILDDIESLWFPVTENIREIEKKTFPVLLGLTLEHPNAQKLASLFHKQEYNRIKICELLDEMEVRTRLMNIALDHRDQAIKSLAKLPNPEGSNILQLWLDWYLRNGELLLQPVVRN